MQKLSQLVKICRSFPYFECCIFYGAQLQYTGRAKKVTPRKNFISLKL